MASYQIVSQSIEINNQKEKEKEKKKEISISKQGFGHSFGTTNKKTNKRRLSY